MTSKRSREAKTNGKSLSRKIETAVSGMNGDLAKILNAAEAGGVGDVEEILKEDACVDAKREKCIKASRELSSALARYTSSEASTIVRDRDGTRWG